MLHLMRFCSPWARDRCRQSFLKHLITFQGAHMTRRPCQKRRLPSNFLFCNPRSGSPAPIFQLPQPAVQPPAPPAAQMCCSWPLPNLRACLLSDLDGACSCERLTRIIRHCFCFDMFPLHHLRHQSATLLEKRSCADSSLNGSYWEPTWPQNSLDSHGVKNFVSGGLCLQSSS